MDVQNDFFTLQSLGTFAGAVGATVVISNSIQRVTNQNPAWLALIIAEFVCIATVFWVHESAPVGDRILYSDYFVAFINGFLVFCSAAGSNSVVGSTIAPTSIPTVSRGHLDKKGQGPAKTTTVKRGFFTPWF